MTRDARSVVLGLGGCLDYEIEWDERVVQGLADRYQVTMSQLDRDITAVDERGLVRSILGFMRSGVGGERFVATPGVVERFAARFRSNVALGGTNLRAAVAMSHLGLASTVHLAGLDDNLLALLPPTTAWISGAEADSRSPHLVVQYPAAGRVVLRDGTVDAPRPNRLIYVNDVANREMVISPSLGRTLEDAGIFLVSGLNSMQDRRTLERRLADLQGHMHHLPDDAVVLFEEAGYHVPGLSSAVRAALQSRIDVHSMNEEELESLLGRSVDLLDAHDVRRALCDLGDLVRAPTVVLHTRHWSLATGPRADAFRAALETGTRTAAARYAHGDAVHRRDYVRLSRSPRPPHCVSLARSLERLMPDRVACVPAYSLSPATPTTVGLGDAFVGGFIAGLVTSRVTRMTGPHTRLPKMMGTRID